MTIIFKEADHPPGQGCTPPIRPSPIRKRLASAKTRRISLALQGGGGFGAFTWGVLDRLLEDGGIAFDAVSGASAGAMNAVLLASGLAYGGPQAARASLDRFWRKISNVGRRSAFAPPDAVLTAMTQSLSPYQFNPLDLNPLRDYSATIWEEFARQSG